MIPKPQQNSKQSAELELRAVDSILVPEGDDVESLLAVAEMLSADLARAGHRPIPVLREAGQEGFYGGRIVLRTDPSASGLAGTDEGYRYEVTSSGVEITARTVAGVFYATRSLVAEAAPGGRLSQGTVVDSPRYSWRGVHLDVARHFFPVSFIKRFIDLLALHKLNVFHWHLTEDQGWRIEVDAYPKLSEISAWRKSEGGTYGGLYTKAEVREVIAYAEARHITVVPEIEMPGHAIAALAAYPELSCSGGPFEVETEWGIFDDVYCAGTDATFTFLEKVLDEVMELFPSKFIHIGGDECPKKRWKVCPRCQARMKAEGLSSEEELQSWFVSKMGRYLSERGRRLVGWDEILEGGLAPGATVMSWRGTEGGIRAAQLGHDVVMSPTQHCYLDYKQSAEDAEPGAWFAPSLDLEQAYSYDPTPSELSEQEARHVLGVQANVWTERMPHQDQVEYMVFPRLCAIAEVGWSGPERDFSDFESRLKKHLLVLDVFDVAYRGSGRSTPVLPTPDEMERYAQARRERAADSSVSLSYT